MNVDEINIELKNDLTSITGAIQTQNGIYIPLKEVERILTNRIKCQISPTDDVIIPFSKQEIEAIKTDVKHIVDTIDLREKDNSLRFSILSKIIKQLTHEV